MDLFDGPPTILDGGLATELERRGNDLSDKLWSARLLVDDPAEITATHETFYRAGAQVATTATYQASFGGFAERGLAESEAARLIRRAVELAVAARDEVGSDGVRRWVAASAGPYGAALADGSEYRGRYGLSVAELAAWHTPRLDVLCDAGADVLALETVPDTDEAEALVRAMYGRAVPAWLTYTIDGDRTRAGQPLDEAFAVVADAAEIVAVGVNCCAPADVEPAVRVARAATDKPIVVYPNSGEGWADRQWTGQSSFDAGLAEHWVAAGAAAVGGCCRVTPADIAELARTMRNDEY
ncbi:homocysteine S-methyltransferase [Nocardioidaceae bacterium SCSIO 66511]|nr:homocysteine S-methyltransferase [Nocardioidaceae bacterium SCSIO 66511]